MKAKDPLSGTASSSRDDDPWGEDAADASTPRKRTRTADAGMDVDRAKPERDGGVDVPADSGASTEPTESDAATADPAAQGPRASAPPIAALAVNAVENLGALVGPAAQATPVRVFGGRTGVTFEHAGQLAMLVGDAWSDASPACPSESTEDDVVTRLPLERPAQLPALEPHPLRLFRDGAAARVGFGVMPLAAFSDGERAFAAFGSDASAELEIGTARADELATYDSVLRVPTTKFSQPALRSVAKFSGKAAGSDYRVGHDALLVWGRPALAAEHGRQAPLYLMSLRLPLAFDDAGHLKFEPQYFAGLDATGEPEWSSDEANARAIALDGRESGDPFELVQIAGRTAIAWVPAPIAKWVMLYGGDLQDGALLDPTSARSKRAPGAIMLRFADHPWGPFTPPRPHAIPSQLAGPGGLLFAPDCRPSNGARCAPSNPLRVATCSPQFPARGFLYGPNIIDRYTVPNAEGGVDLVWNVSTWNPYGIQLLRTKLTPGPEPAVQGELADDRGLERLRTWNTLPRLGTKSRYRQQSSRERGVMQNEFLTLFRGGNRDFNNFVCASPDANIGLQLSPIKYDQPACEEPYVRGAVMARFVGAGRHVRSWIAATSLRTGIGDQILRLYVDDEPKPRVEAPLARVLDGSAGEIFAPPFGAGSTKRASWYYPIAFKQKLIATLDNLVQDDHWFQWDVMLDDEANDASAEVAPYSSRREAAAAQLSAVYHPAGTLSPLAEAQMFELAGKETRRVELQGPATLGELRVRLAESDYARLADVRVRIRWDEDAEPAIDVSLLELLGNGRVPPAQSTLALTSFLEDSSRTLALNLPMPFQSAASIELENASDAQLKLELSLLGKREVPSGAFGRLHVQRRDTVGPTDVRQHLAVQASGTGRLAGVCVFLQGTADPDAALLSMPLNALEGDVHARIDGETALDGTGTEEYADDIYYFEEAPQASPFVQAWGVQSDRSPGMSNSCRWHVLGTELDFASSIELAFDLGGSQNPSVVQQLRTVAYLYQ